MRFFQETQAGGEPQSPSELHWNARTGLETFMHARHARPGA